MQCKVCPRPSLGISEGMCLYAAGGHAAHSNPNDYVTYAGLTLKKPPTWEYAASKLIGGTMWWVCCCICCALCTLSCCVKSVS
jgi:hypothetical protein